MERLLKLKNKKIAIDGLMRNFSNKMTSHKSSWAYMLKNQLQYIGYNANVLHKNDPWSEYDVIILDWGMEFKGTFNVFGGANNDLYYRLKQLLDYNGEIISANIPFPDISNFIKTRLKTGTSLFKTLDPENFKLKLIDIKWFDHVFESPNVCFGDSHILSAYHPGYMIFRNDGLTLHSALDKKIKNFIPSFTEKLIIYLSSIDIRHHLLRLYPNIDDAIVAQSFQLIEFEKQLKELNLKYIKIIKILPIEFENRKLPKTGYYKNKPFWGNINDRSKLVEYTNNFFENISLKNNWETYSWPENWYNIDPKKFAEEYMEKPKSIHLGRHSYIYNFDTSKLNEKLFLISSNLDQTSNI